MEAEAAPGGARIPPAPPAAARRWTLNVEAGPSFLSFAGVPLSRKTLLHVGVAGWYQFVAGGFTLDAGVTGRFVPLPYDPIDGQAGDTSHIWTTLAAVRIAHTLGGSFSVGAEAGSGIGVWTGLKAGNPFTLDGVDAGGPVLLPTLGLGTGLGYAVSPRVWVTGGVFYSVGSVTRAGPFEAVSRVNQLDAHFGVALRL